MPEVAIEPTWRAALAAEFAKPYFAALVAFVKEAYRTKRVYPPGRLIFNAFAHCPFDQVKVVVIGQDPYHRPGQAEGLAFSVPRGEAIPPSLGNIFRELQDDLGKTYPQHGSLVGWAKQGVLLLNAILTVEAHKPGSHQRQGWETFTDAVVERLSSQCASLVFLLWGAYAQRKGAMVDTSRHLVLTASHPSPFSVQGFLGKGHFSQANAYLRAQGKEPIVW